MSRSSNSILGIIFDLDGTLYESPDFAATIQEASAGYIAGLRGISQSAARQLMSDSRSAMAEDTGYIPTLSAVCTALGGTVRDLHAFFEMRLQPEAHLVRDLRVIALLENLAQRMTLYLFTNNNRTLTNRIIVHLGLNGLFRHI